MGVEPRLQASLNIFVKSIGRQGNNGDRFRVLPVHSANDVGRLQSVHFRHPHIHQDRIIIPRFVTGKLIHGNLSVLRHVRFNLPHLKNHDHDFRIDGHVFRQQDTATAEVRLLILHDRAFLLERVPEFIQHRSRKQRLGHKRVHTGVSRFIGNIVPVVGSQDNDGSILANDGTNLPGRFHPVHFRHLPVYQNQVIGFPAGTAHPHHLHPFPAGQRCFAVNTNLPHYYFCVFAGNGIIVDNKHAHILWLQVFRFFLLCFTARISQCNGYGERGTPALFTFHFNITVHQLHQAFGNRHAQSCTAVLVCRRGILLAERVKNFRQVLFAHADACIADDKTQCGVSFKPRHILYNEAHLSARRRELHRITQNIDQHLPQFHIVADVIIIDISYDAAFVIQPLVPALAADHGVDLFQGLGEVKLLLPDHHAPRLDAGHIQDIVDNTQQMMGGRADLFQRLPGLRGKIRIVQGNIVQADDGVHGRTDLVAHAGKERRFSPVRLFRCSQRVIQRLGGFHILPGFRIHIGKAEAHRMYDVVVPVFRMAYAGNLGHLIGFLPVPAHHIPERNDPLLFQRFPDRVRIGKTQVLLPVGLCHIFIGIFGYGGKVRETFPHLKAVFDIGMVLVTDPFVFVQFDIIDAPVVGGQRRNQLILPFPQQLLSLELLLQRLPVPHVFIYVPETQHDPDSAVRHIRPGHFNPVITMAAVLHQPLIADAEMGPFLQAAEDPVPGQFRPQAFLIFRNNGMADIILPDFGIIRQTRSV